MCVVELLLQVVGVSSDAARFKAKEGCRQRAFDSRAVRFSGHVCNRRSIVVLAWFMGSTVCVPFEVEEAIDLLTAEQRLAGLVS